jgi:predicted transcriptional regulator
MDPIYERFLAETKARNSKIIALRKAGFSAAEIAKLYGLTPQRVSKICEPLRTKAAAR